MHTDQAMPITSGPSFRPLLTTISTAFRRLAAQFPGGETAGDMPAGAELAPSIRYDIGEIECRPSQPSSRQGTERFQPQTLEGIWLRYY